MYIKPTSVNDPVNSASDRKLITILVRPLLISTPMSVICTSTMSPILNCIGSTFLNLIIYNKDLKFKSLCVIVSSPDRVVRWIFSGRIVFNCVIDAIEVLVVYHGHQNAFGVYHAVNWCHWTHWIILAQHEIMGPNI